MDEVLQTDIVFTNVSKGQEAKKADLVKAFGTDDRKKICQVILEKGEAQVSQKERQIQNDSQYREIAKIIADKTYNTETKRPFPIIQIETEMKNLHFSIKPSKSAKQQALLLINELKHSIPIERAQMRLCAEFPKQSGALKKDIKSLAATVETEEIVDDRFKIQFLVDAGNFIRVEELMRSSQGTLEIVDFKNVIDTDESLD